MRTFQILIYLLFCSSCINMGGKGDLIFKDSAFATSNNINLELVRKQILTPKCLKCHNWMSDDNKILEYIVPGEPENSLLYLRTNDGTMPFRSTPLSQDDLSLIYRYILEIE